MMIADILISSAAVIMSIAVLVMSLKGFRRIEANVGQVRIMAEQIDKAVNNVGPNEPTLRNMVSQLVGRLDTHITDTERRLAVIETQLVRRKTPSTPKKGK